MLMLLLKNDLILVELFWLLLALDGSQSQDGKDPEHPEENTNATAEDERDGTAFPRTEDHERAGQALHERMRAGVVLVRMEMWVWVHAAVLNNVHA